MPFLWFISLFSITLTILTNILSLFPKNVLYNEIHPKLLKSLDSDSNGTIEYQEFLRGVCDKDSLFDNNNLKNAFDCIDEGMKGYINSNDIKRFIFQEKGITDILFKEYLEQFGMNINDKLTYDDFAFIIKNNEKLRKNN